MRNELIEIADQLNSMLEEENLDEKRLSDLTLSLNHQEWINFKLLDFFKYTEDELKRLADEKIEKIKEQSFDGAADIRLQEKECLKYMNLQKYFKLKHSFFYPEEYKLFYFHMGTAKNDRLFLKYFS